MSLMLKYWLNAKAISILYFLPIISQYLYKRVLIYYLELWLWIVYSTILKLTRPTIYSSKLQASLPRTSDENRKRLGSN